MNKETARMQEFINALNTQSYISAGYKTYQSVNGEIIKKKLL